METILVFSDGPIQGSTRRLLEQAGYRVITASFASDTVKSLGGAKPTLVILDLHRLGKAEQVLCHLIRETASNVPLLVMSDTNDANDVVRFIGLGADDYLTNPVHPQELLARVRAAIRRSTSISNPA